MLRRRMMMAQGGMPLPSGYTKIEYLESDGNHYIDTGFKPNQDTRVVMDVQLLNTPTNFAAVFGARDSNAKQFWVYYRYTISSWSFRYQGGTEHPIEKTATQRVLIDADKNALSIDGNTVTATAAIFSVDYNIYLFALNEAGSSRYPTIARIYSCQIYDNGTLVHDFIPATNASGEAGLYDLKNDVWYGFRKPKVENKISLKTSISGNPTATPPITTHHGYVYATYPVTSNVKVNLVSLNGTEKTLTLSKGFSSTSEVLLGINAGRFTITSISPTEDDTYIYTF